MKFTKTLAAIAAASLAVSSLAVSAFAADALVSMTVTKSSGPKDAGEVNLWELPFDETVYTWAGDVDKAVATITSEAYANGALGANTVAADGWAASAQLENSAAGTNEWVWDGIGGLKSGLGEDGSETGYFKVEVWWMNAQDDGSAATLTVDKVDFYNKSGDLLATYPVADDDTPADDTPKAIQTTAEIAAVNASTPSYTYTVKGDIDTLKVDVAVSPDDGDAFSWNDWCGAGVAVKNPDGTVKYYQFGGAQVTWGWDLDGDKVDESEGGANGTTWVGTVANNGGELSIPVVKGSVVEFYCLSWLDDEGNPKYEKTQYTLTINDVEAAADDVDVDPGESSGEVPEDPANPGDTEIPAEPEDPAKPGDTTVPAEPEDPAKPGDTTVPDEPDDPIVNPDDNKPGNDDNNNKPGNDDNNNNKPGDSNKPADDNKKPTNADTGVTASVVPAALAAAAVAVAGIVLKKRK